MSFILEKVNWLKDKSTRIHRDKNVKSYFIAIPAFVLVGSIFFYFVNWVSEVKRDRSGVEVERAALVVLKKIPTVLSNELAPILPNTGMEYQSAVRSKEKAVIGDAQPTVDSHEPQLAVKKLPSPSDDTQLIPGTPNGNLREDERSYSEFPVAENTDTSAPPEEPDPASAIDYVFKKRKFSP